MSQLRTWHTLGDLVGLSLVWTSFGWFLVDPPGRIAIRLICCSLLRIGLVSLRHAILTFKSENNKTFYYSCIIKMVEVETYIKLRFCFIWNLCNFWFSHNFLYLSYYKHLFCDKNLFTNLLVQPAEFPSGLETVTAWVWPTHRSEIYVTD